MRITLLFLVLTLNSFSVLGQVEKGIGVIFFPQSNPKLDDSYADTVKIYCKENQNSDVLEEFYFNPRDRFKSLVNTSFDSANLIEFDNETFGLPVTSVSKNDEWYEVVYNKHKEPGYVKMDGNKLAYLGWKDILIKRALFFESAYEISFFNKPDGVVQEFLLAPSQSLKFDYIMRPLEISGKWMKVEVTTPSDYCRNPAVKKNEVFWIKYLSENNRPMVWYHPRGC